METLKKQIIEKIESAGFKVDMENVSWKKEDTYMTNGSMLNINGQTFQQPGKQIKVSKHFTIQYICNISNVDGTNSHDSLMCVFEVYEGDHKIQDLEINFYSDEFNFFDKLFQKIFNI